MAAHLRTEAYLSELSTANKDFTYTIIRQGLYSTSYPIYTAAFDVKDPGDGIIRIPHHGGGEGISWAKREELGEATANIIADYHNNPATFPLINKRVVLSGAKSYSLNETVEVFTRILDKEVKVEEVDLEEYVKLPKVRASFPEGEGEEDWPRLWATAWEGVRRGETSTVNGELEKWLGREPEGFETTIRGIVGK
jgi:hypothetical protein